MKKYDVKDDDDDEEGIENFYGDMYLNEEIILDILISEFENVIVEKKKNEEDGFKREYVVSYRNYIDNFLYMWYVYVYFEWIVWLV